MRLHAQCLTSFSSSFIALHKNTTEISNEISLATLGPLGQLPLHQIARLPPLMLAGASWPEDLSPDLTACTRFCSAAFNENANACARFHYEPENTHLQDSNQHSTKKEWNNKSETNSMKPKEGFCIQKHPDLPTRSSSLPIAGEGPRLAKVCISRLDVQISLELCLAELISFEAEISEWLTLNTLNTDIFRFRSVPFFGVRTLTPIPPQALRAAACLLRLPMGHNDQSSGDTKRFLGGLSSGDRGLHFRGVQIHLIGKFFSPRLPQ